MKIKSEKKCGTFTFLYPLRRKEGETSDRVLLVCWLVWSCTWWLVVEVELLVTPHTCRALQARLHAFPNPLLLPCLCAPLPLCLLRQAACIRLVVSHPECEDLSAFNLFIISKYLERDPRAMCVPCSFIALSWELLLLCLGQIRHSQCVWPEIRTPLEFSRGPGNIQDPGIFQGLLKVQDPGNFQVPENFHGRQS